MKIDLLDDVVAHSYFQDYLLTKCNALSQSGSPAALNLRHTRTSKGDFRVFGRRLKCSQIVMLKMLASCVTSTETRT